MATPPRDFREWMRTVERKLAQAVRTGNSAAITELNKEAAAIRDEIAATAGDPRIPAAPTEFTVQSSLHVDDNGRTYGRIFLDFTTVTKATDATNLNVDYYELWGRDETAWDGAEATTPEWKLIDTAVTSHFYSQPFEAGSKWRLRVRAIGVTTPIPGQWSIETVITVAVDTTPPPIPSAPVLSQQYSVVTVAFDGLAANGAAQPADYAHTEVAVDQVSSPTKVFALFRGAASTVIAGLPQTGPTYVRFRSVDFSGNKSAWSVQRQITPKSLVSGDISGLDTTLAQQIERSEAAEAAALASAAEAQQAAAEAEAAQQAATAAQGEADAAAAQAANSAATAATANAEAAAARAAADQAAADSAAAQVAATQAESAAQQALLDLQDTMDNSGKIIRSETAPTGDDQNHNNLWIKDSTGESFTWDPVDNRWELVDNAAYAAAAAAADAAADRAEAAEAAAQQAEADAAAAQTAASTAAGTANTAKTAAETAQAAAATAQGNAKTSADAAAASAQSAANAVTTANTAKATAEDASNRAELAAGLATTKGRTWAQNATPPKDHVYNWVGTANLSASRHYLNDVLVGTNLVPDGSFEAGTGTWINNGGGVVMEQSSTVALFGTKSLKIDPKGIENYGYQNPMGAGWVVTGKTYTLSVYVYSELAQTLALYNYHTSVNGPSVEVPAKKWTRLYLTQAIPAGATNTYISVRRAGRATAPTLFYMDGYMIEEGTVLNDFYNGNTADSREYDLWINTTNSANTPNRWNGNGWTVVTDKAAADAATAAVAAQNAAVAAEQAAETAQAEAATSAQEAAASAAEAATAQANADAALADATAAQNAATAAQQAAVAAEARADAAEAAAAQSAADAQQSMADLATYIGTSGRVIYQDAEPTGDARNKNNLWIKKTGGDSYTFDPAANGGAGAWVKVVNAAVAKAAADADAAADRAAEAQSAAAASQAAAQAAEQAASAAEDNATALTQSAQSAAAAATAAEQRAANAEAAAVAADATAAQSLTDVQNLMDNAGKIIYQDETPAVADQNPNNLWIKDSTGDAYAWDTAQEQWVLVESTAVRTAAFDADAAADRAEAAEAAAVTARNDATAARTDATNAQAAAVTAQQEAAAAEARADAAEAAAAASAADAAAAQAAADQSFNDLQGYLDDAGKIIRQETAPTGTDQSPNNLWIKNSTGEPYTWVASANNGAGAWVIVTDQRVVQMAADADAAADAAEAAQAEADAAKTASQTAQQNAQTAAGSASTAQQAADAAAAAANQSQAEADAAAAAAAASAADAAQSAADADAAAQAAGSSSAAALVAQEAAEAANEAADAAVEVANAAMRAAVNTVVDPGFENGVWVGVSSRFVEDATEFRTGKKSIKGVAGSGSSSIRIASNVPVKMGDTWRASVWVKTSADYNGTSSYGKLRLSRDNSAVFANAKTWPLSPNGWTEVIYDQVIPAGWTDLSMELGVDHTVGTIWFDDATFTNYTDQKAALAAAKAAQDAADTANSAAGSAQDTADSALSAATHAGKAFFSADPPSGTAPKDSTWQQYDTDGRIIGSWQQTGGTATTDGGTWTKRQLTSAQFDNFDAGKITFGTMSGARIQAGTLTISSGEVPNLPASKITSGTLPAAVTVPGGSVSGAVASATTATTAGSATNATNVTGSIGAGVSVPGGQVSGTVPVAAVPALPTSKITNLDSNLSALDAAAQAAMVASAYSKNPSFDTWTSTIPADYNSWGTVTPTKDTANKRVGAHGLNFNVTASGNQAGVSITGGVGHMPNVEYATVEVEFMLKSGTLAGSGVQLVWNGMSGTNYVRISLATEVPAPTLNKWHRVTVTVARPSSAGTFTSMTAYLFANYSSIGAAVKDITFDWLNIRPATDQEVDALLAKQKTDQWQAANGGIKADQMSGIMPVANMPGIDVNNLWKSPYFLPTTGGANGLGTLYTGTEIIPAGNATELSGRDHIGADKFPIMPGEKFVIEFTGKITAGALIPNVGVWMTKADGGAVSSQLNGWNSYDSAMFAPIKLADLANGFARYRYIHTIPNTAGMQASATPPRTGQLYFQLNQSSPFGAKYIISDVSIRRVNSDAEIDAVSGSKITGTVPVAAVPAIPIDRVTNLDGKINLYDANGVLLNSWKKTGTTYIDGGQLFTDSVTALAIAANAIEADHILAGAVEASKLESTLILTTQIIAGDPMGTHAVMDGGGFRVYAADPTDSGGDGIPNEVVRMGVAATDDYFAVSRADGTLAATISQDGIGSFDEVNAKEVYVNGEPMSELQWKAPRGHVGSAFRTTYSAYNAVAGQPRQPYLRYDVELQAGRLYRVSTSHIRMGVTVGGNATIYMIANSGGVAGEYHPIITYAETNKEGEGVMLSEYYTPSLNGAEIEARGKKLCSFLIAFSSAAGECGIRANDQRPVRLMVEDVGPLIATYAGTHLNGANQTPPPPQQVTYVRQYGCHNSMNYLGNNGQYQWDLGHVYQGLSPAGHGNLKSIALMNDWVGDLSGATINYIRVYFNFQHWYYNSGGTARIGLHGHTTIPGSFSHGGVVTTSGGWPKPGARWVDIPSGHWGGFKSGQWRGISLEGDSSYGTYGYADRPTVEISFTK